MTTYCSACHKLLEEKESERYCHCDSCHCSTPKGSQSRDKREREVDV